MNITSSFNGLFVYRLGHWTFTPVRGVRFPYRLPFYVWLFNEEKQLGGGYITKIPLELEVLLKNFLVAGLESGILCLLGGQSIQ